MTGNKFFSKKINKFKVIAVLVCINVVFILWIGSFHSNKWIVKMGFTARHKRNNAMIVEVPRKAVSHIPSPLESRTTLFKKDNGYRSTRYKNNTQNGIKTNGEIKTSDSIERPETVGSKCPNILSEVSKGKWIRRNLTVVEQNTVDAYLKSERGAYSIPSTFQRADGRCGNVPYEKSPLYRHMWFKAICNPKGPTPCCRLNRCESLSMEQCLCTECYDERSAIHAEFAKWQPNHAACEVHNHSTSEACELLEGSTISFIGDSFIRHVFVSLVILLTGNPNDGALKPDLFTYQRRMCSGWHQVTGLTCRALLVEQRSLCGGTVQVDYTEVFPAKNLPLAIPILQAHSRDKGKKSLIILGLGIHNDFRIDDVSDIFLKPFLNIHQFLRRHPQDIVSVVNALRRFKKAMKIDYSLILDNILQNNKNLYFDKLSKDSNDTSSNSNISTSSNNGTSFSDFKYVNFSYNLFDIQKMEEILQEKQKKDIDMNITQSQLVLKSNQTQRPTLNLSADPIEYDISNSDTPISEYNKKPPLNLMWLGIHAPGVLKSPKFARQTAPGVISFNQGIYKLLDQWNVPYLDTFSFTDGTVSFDGTHYGWGINMLKTNTILTFIKEKLRPEYWHPA